MIDDPKEQLWKIMEIGIDSSIALGPGLVNALFISDMQNGLRFFSPFFKDESDEAVWEEAELAISLIRRGQKEKRIKAGDPEMMYRTFISAMYGTAMDWSSKNGSYDEKTVLRSEFDTVF